MSSKKIDRIYQEKLKDLEMNPNAEVWNRIEKTLVTQKKSKKRFIWWFTSVGSVAAILFLIFLNTDTVNEVKVTTKLASKELTKEKEEAQKETKEILAENRQKIEGGVESDESNIVSTESLLKSTLPTSEIAFEEKILVKKMVASVEEKSVEKREVFASSSDHSQQVLGDVEKVEEVLEIEKDLISTETRPKKSLEETLLAEKEEKEETASKVKGVLKSWSVAPVISQYVYNSFSDNSTIDDRLNDAEKSGQSNLSYGVSVAYSVSKKLKIRAGIHRVRMGQSTQKQSLNPVFSRVSSYENTESQVVEINTNSSGSSTISAVFSDVETAQSSDIRSLSSTNSQLEQRFGYIEIPVDVNYNLFTAERFFVYLSGGFSTLFLTENSLIEESSTYSRSLGGATNLNELNFSLNFGTDLEYHFSEQWFINLNPSIKVQTQTFNKDSNQPYLLGVSSGINYKF